MMAAHRDQRRSDTLTTTTSSVLVKAAMETDIFRKRLEELELIRCSLLPGEVMEFIEDAEFWDDIIARYMDVDLGDSNLRIRASTSLFSIKVENRPLWLQVTMYMQSEGELVTVKGDDMRRSVQERWADMIRAKQHDLEDNEYVAGPSISTMSPEH